jgi:hypothetical protein
LDTDPVDLGGYANGYDYATASIGTSFLDIEGWLSGYDNGRAGCGALGNCPRTWVSPYFNSGRNDSYDILDNLGSVTMGEQKISPYPHWTLNYETLGARFDHVSLPPSEWYIDTNIAQKLEQHTTATVQALVDKYYELGTLINLYGHSSSIEGTQRDYVDYNLTKPRNWATNAAGIYDWWVLRDLVIVTPSYSKVGETAIATASISGATDPATAIEMVIPHIGSEAVGNIEVFLDGVLADASDYRITDYGVKVLVGNTVSNVEVQYSPMPGPPIANDDSVNTTINKFVNFDVAANDIDLNGNLDPTTTNISCLTCTVPSNGSLLNIGDGTFIYTPNPGFTGEDTFVYEICDSDDLCDTATVAITITTGAATVRVQVSSSSDDAEEQASGLIWNLASSDLELVYDSSDQTVGMRFNGVNIPPGANITSATRGEYYECIYSIPGG